MRCPPDKRILGSFLPLNFLKNNSGVSIKFECFANMLVFSTTKMKILLLYSNAASNIKQCRWQTHKYKVNVLMPSFYTKRPHCLCSSPFKIKLFLNSQQ